MRVGETMSTSGNGHSGNGNKPIVEQAVSAESEGGQRFPAKLRRLRVN